MGRKRYWENIGPQHGDPDQRLNWTFCRGINMSLADFPCQAQYLLMDRLGQEKHSPWKVMLQVIFEPFIL